MSQSKTTLQNLILVSVLTFPSLLMAQGGGLGRFEARAQSREASRWTLSEWLAQKDRNRLMDMWLSMNSPSPFEFMLGASHIAREVSTIPATDTSSHVSLAGEVHAYAQFIGLTLEHENSTQEGLSDLTGLLNIRLLGDSLQNSSLTLHAGQRSRNVSGETETRRNILTQASLRLYFTRYFGVDGFYRQAHSVHIDSQNGQIGGTLTELGAFIDFRAVRVFGAWLREVERLEADTGTRSDTLREGIKTGLKIHY